MSKRRRVRVSSWPSAALGSTQGQASILARVAKQDIATNLVVRPFVRHASQERLLLEPVLHSAHRVLLTQWQERVLFSVLNAILPGTRCRTSIRVLV